MASYFRREMRLLISAGTEDLIAALNCRDYNEAGKSTDLKLRVATRSAEAEKARNVWISWLEGCCRLLRRF